MSVVGGLRQCQLEILLIECKLGEITAEQREHPDKASPGDSHEKQQAWVRTKALYDKRRKLLRERLAELREEARELEATLHNKGLSAATLGHIIGKLAEIEVKFTAETWGDAWGSLSAFIDWLEQEEARLSAKPELKAVA
jgi:hypothetical protein